MKKFTAILVLSVDNVDSGREMVENIENTLIKVDFGSGCESGACGLARDIIAKKMGLDEDSFNEVRVLPISDFMDLCNNEEFEESGSWIGYVTIEVTAKDKSMSKPIEITKEEAESKMELVYIEMPSGFHIAIDASYLDQEGDFTIKLPTGEKLDTKDLGKD